MPKNLTKFGGNGNPARTRAAFTLIEIVITILLAGALSGGVIVFVTQGVDIWNFITFRTDEAAQARSALDRMVREMRHVYDKSSVAMAAGGEFNFMAYYNNSYIAVDFFLSGNELMRNTDALTSGVSALRFDYYDINNNLLVNPRVLPYETDIRRIKITLTVASADQQITLQSQVYPRNF